MLADLLFWQAPKKYDAIVTCFFLDCFPADTLANVIAKLANCATDDATWLVVDFAIPQSGLAHYRARIVHTLMYAFFRSVVGLSAKCLVAPDDLLRAQGFRLAARQDSEWGLLRSDLWQRGVRANPVASTQ
jgi:hypothetical protein